jgi:RNA polymerase sporulation-specific sigma factor
MTEYNDYELVALAKEGNEDATNILYQKYKPIIVKKSENMIVRASHHGIEISDIMQEGFIALEEAIMNFSENDNASFYTFAMLCINRQIINFLRKTTGGRDKILNDAVVIDDYMEKNMKDDFDTEFSLINKETENNVIDKLRSRLTLFEGRVFDMKLAGYSIEEIAKTLDRDTKSIYNTFNRLKSKIKKIIEEDDYL